MTVKVVWSVCFPFLFDAEARHEEKRFIGATYPESIL